MKRRKFLALSGIATVGVLVPAVGISSTSFLKVAIIDVINKELYYLKLNPEGVERFASDYITATEGFSFIKTQRARLKLSANYFMNNSVEKLKTPEIATLYLISSDFFHNKMDETKVVNYSGVRDLFKMPCVNPFSHLYYPQKFS